MCFLLLIDDKGLLIHEKENKKWDGSHISAGFLFEQADVIMRYQKHDR